MKVNMNQSTFKLSNGAEFTIIHNVPMKGNIGSINAALSNWLARTDILTAESFCEYINSKGQHMAFTKEHYDREINKSNIK